MKPVELKYYPFVISIDNRTGNCNVLSPKTCVPKEIEDIQVKTFNMIANKNKIKKMIKHIACECKYKFNKRSM